MPVLRKRTAMRQAGLITSARDRVWAAIRELHGAGRFSALDVASRADVPMGTAREHLRRLVAAGIVAEAIENDCRRRSVFRLVQDRGVEAPRVRRDGAVDQEPTNRERMWAAMKAMGTFTVRDLRVGSGVESFASLGTYCSVLRNAGYLKVVNAGNRPERYRLLPHMNTGPRPPVCGRRAVFDPNLGRQVWPTEGNPQ